jgi:hypothetical protein
MMQQFHVDLDGMELVLTGDLGALGTRRQSRACWVGLVAGDARIQQAARKKSHSISTFRRSTLANVRYCGPLPGSVLFELQGRGCTSFKMFDAGIYTSGSRGHIYLQNTADQHQKLWRNGRCVELVED